MDCHVWYNDGGLFNGAAAEGLLVKDSAHRLRALAAERETRAATMAHPVPDCNQEALMAADWGSEVVQEYNAGALIMTS
jgi:hypothetical protein